MSEQDPGRETARAAYGASVEAVREAFRFGVEAAQSRLSEAAAGLLAALAADEAALLLLSARSTAGNHLYAHAANTAILAMHTAAGLGCPEDKRLALGLCALTVDLRRAAALARPLSQAEQEQLLHPLDPGKIFEHSLELEKVVPEELRSLYRADLGTEELAHAEKRREAHQGAHILAICDTYEAATHYRPWRAPILPRNAVLGLLGKHRRESDQKLVKTFTERISIYPPGSYVQLSNMDIGQVLRVQPFAPSSPVVEIRARADGSRQAPFYSVDLAKTQSSHVRQAVDETDDSIKDVALRVALQAERWWML